MNRRRFVATASSVAVLATSGCSRLSPSNSAPEHPGGSIYLSNTARSELTVTVSTVDYEPAKSLETTVPSGEHVVQPEFVSAAPGAAVTVAARIGDDGDRLPFEFLPAGGGDGSDAPPEYARLSIRNAVEASAEWTARPGT
ncbi:hypothetical protein G9C85_14075 [Halorubellus sp. JP-L1]|uniref:hypothetical protein n=1 Tax=Halorubellus sp. JP-L1 TaxID=2715753 RepID=UPI00140DA2DE|nr:hypothetical protein [Halorubellus sp. JP-L1]NHN42749.1 hypothetical protein [Halorubellus sp. JP-L1]